MRRRRLLKHTTRSFSSLRFQIQLPKPVGIKMEPRSTQKAKPTANHQAAPKPCPYSHLTYLLMESLVVKRLVLCSQMWPPKVVIDFIEAKSQNHAFSEIHKPTQLIVFSLDLSKQLSSVSMVMRLVR